MASKRKLDYFEVSEAKESSSAVVDGMLIELSLVKKSKRDDSVKYFTGEVCDGKGSVRVICFEPQLRAKLSSAFEEKSAAVSLVNCQVRAARGGGSEILLTKSSKVEASPKKFSGVDVAVRKEPAVIKMNDVSTVTIDQAVTVTVKVISVEPPQEVKNRDGKILKKQDCVVGDCDGCGRVVLWEEDVGNMEEGRSYKLKGVTVRSYRGADYLSVGKECEIMSVEDIGETANIQEGDLEEKGIVRKVVEGDIDGVVYVEDYEGCIGCTAKVTGGDEVAAECTKCGMWMKRSKCKRLMTARVVVDGSDGKRHTLMMFTDALKSIIGEGETNVRLALLSTGKLKFLVDKGDVVYSVQQL